MRMPDQYPSFGPADLRVGIVTAGCSGRFGLALEFHGPKPVVWSHGFQGSGFCLIWSLQTLDKDGDGSYTSGPTTCVVVAPRFFLSSAFRTMQVRARLHSDAGVAALTVRMPVVRFLGSDLLA